MNLFLPYHALNSFNDVVLLRDPRGRSIFRSLHQLPPGPAPAGKNKAVRPAGIGITGPFLVHQLFCTSREQGITFVTATGDENPIHREGDIVPGAMSGARAIASLEALFPRLGVRRVKFKFRSIARYGKPSRQRLSVTFPKHDTVDVRLRIDQEGQAVAEGFISGTIFPEIQRPSVGKWRVNKDELHRVEEFFRSMGILPELYLRAGSEPNFAYPRAFLSTLPSGEMVRQLSGEGGLLTTLDLSFPETPPPGITGSGKLEVGLEPGKQRPTFMKVLTSIKSGVEEHCKGFALVFSPGADNPLAL